MKQENFSLSLTILDIVSPARPFTCCFTDVRQKRVWSICLERFIKTDVSQNNRVTASRLASEASETECKFVIGERAKRTRHYKFELARYMCIRECASTLYLGLITLYLGLITPYP